MINQDVDGFKHISHIAGYVFPFEKEWSHQMENRGNIIGGDMWDTSVKCLFLGQNCNLS